MEDPETKRKIIGTKCIAVFEELGNLLGKKLRMTLEFLLQGTIDPNMIESRPPLSDESTGKEISPSWGNSQKNKSHHNVGEVPGIMRLKTVEPLKWFFKDEVRKLGGFLGIPQSFLNRHPFPRPGLAIRILGDVTHNDALETLRQVNEIFVTCIWEANPYDKMWQAFVKSEE